MVVKYVHLQFLYNFFFGVGGEGDESVRSISIAFMLEGHFIPLFLLVQRTFRMSL